MVQFGFDFAHDRNNAPRLRSLFTFSFSFLLLEISILTLALIFSALLAVVACSILFFLMLDTEPT